MPPFCPQKFQIPRRALDIVIIHLAPTLLLIRNVHKPAGSHKRYIAQGSCANVENCEVVWGLAGNIVRAAADLNCLPFLPSLELQASGDHCLFLLHQLPGMPFTSKVESKLICVPLSPFLCRNLSSLFIDIQISCVSLFFIYKVGNDYYTGVYISVGNEKTSPKSIINIHPLINYHFDLEDPWYWPKRLDGGHSEGLVSSPRCI